MVVMFMCIRWEIIKQFEVKKLVNGLKLEFNLNGLFANKLNEQNILKHKVKQISRGKNCSKVLAT